MSLRHFIRLIPLFAACIALSLFAAPSPDWVQEAAKKLVAHQKTEGWPKVASDTILKTLNSASGPVHDSALLQAGLQETLAQWGLPDQSILSPNDFTYWLLRTEAGKPTQIRDTGIWPLRRGKRWYAQYVLPGSPAAKAGLVRGDELITLNGKDFAPHALFTAESESLRLAYRRQSWEEPKELKLNAPKQDPQMILQRAMQGSEQVLQKGKKKIGYLHLWWLGDEQSLKALEQSLRRLEERADTVVLDLRDSIPIRKAGLLGLFLQQSKNPRYRPLLSKPMVLLVNGRTSGINEWLAGMLQKEGRARLVGTATAGEFLETRSYWLADEQWLLRLPLKDPEGNIPFHQGEPLQPNIVAPDDLVFSGGTDSVAMRGMSLAAEVH